MSVKWEVVYVEDTDDENSEQEQRDKGYTLPEYVFTVESTDGEVVSSKGPVLKVADWIEMFIYDHNEKPVSDKDYELKLPDGSIRKGKLDSDGYVFEENLMSYHIDDLRFYVDGLPVKLTDRGNKRRKPNG